MCPECGEPVLYPRVYCSAICRQRAKYARGKLSGLEARKRALRIARYESRRRPTRTCSVEGCDGKHVARGMCRNHYRQAKCAEGDPSYMGGGTHNFRSKARRYGVEYEPIRKVSIFERDGWTCGICSDPVDRALSWPDRLSASLDHIIPISRGGAHVTANVQCSHLVCNIRKKDHTEEASWVPSEMLSMVS